MDTSEMRGKHALPTTFIIFLPHFSSFVFLFAKLSENNHLVAKFVYWSINL